MPLQLSCNEISCPFCNFFPFMRQISSLFHEHNNSKRPYQIFCICTCIKQQGTCVTVCLDMHLARLLHCSRKLQIELENIHYNYLTYLFKPKLLKFEMMFWIARNRMLMSNKIYKFVKKCFVNVHSINRIQVMSDTHKFKSVTKSFTWHTKYANAHNVIPIIRLRVYCVVSAAKPLMQPKTLVRKYQTILRFILDLLKLVKSLEKNLECTLHISYVIQNQ